MDPEGMFAEVQDYYARFRPPVTSEVVNAIIDLSLPGVTSGSLLDLGTGTGQVVLAMAAHFRHIYAVELDQGMLQRASHDWDQVNLSKASKVEWILADVEDYVLPSSSGVRLVTACRAFHWMDQPKVLMRYANQLPWPASFAVFGDSSFWESSQDWAVLTKETVQSFLGEQRKARAGAFVHHRRPYSEILQESAFSDVRERIVPVTRTWTPAQVIGYLYSTTFGARELFGQRRPEFEATLLGQLQVFTVNGVLTEQAEFKVCVGSKS